MIRKYFIYLLHAIASVSHTMAMAKPTIVMYIIEYDYVSSYIQPSQSTPGRKSFPLEVYLGNSDEFFILKILHHTRAGYMILIEIFLFFHFLG